MTDKEGCYHGVSWDSTCEYCSLDAQAVAAMPSSNSAPLSPVLDSLGVSDSDYRGRQAAHLYLPNEDFTGETGNSLCGIIGVSQAAKIAGQGKANCLDCTLVLKSWHAQLDGAKERIREMHRKEMSRIRSL